MINALAHKLRQWVDLTETEAKLLASLPGKKCFFARGEDPLEKTQRVDHAMLMLDGWAAQYKDRPNGRRVIVELLLPGDITRAEPLVMSDGSVGMVMLSAGCVQFVPSEAMEEILQHEAIAAGMRWAELARESVHREWIVNVGSRKVHVRLAHLLCELSVRMQGAVVSDGIVCEMPLTQADLADALCVSDVHLNVAMQGLRRSGMIQVAAKRLRILDWSRLAALAEFDDEYLHPRASALQDEGSDSSPPGGGGAKSSRKSNRHATAS